MKYIIILAGLALITTNAYVSAQNTLSYPIVDTDQEIFYDTIDEIPAPNPGEIYYGQDANYAGFAPSYQDNGDGTISDLVTGLMWSKSPDIDGNGDINYADKMSYSEALAGADTFSLAGYNDWRLPSIKEMYSLIIFSGRDPSGYNGTSTEDLVPFIDTDYFDFAYGDVSAGERIIDAQMASSNIYVSTTMGGDETMFGVNFADGRIKGYPTGPMPGQTEDKQFYVYYVRGNSQYGTNDFQDNGDGTITDNATGLMWTQNDDGNGMSWSEALTYAEGTEFAGYGDWRLPNVKELQSLIDYTRSPATSNSAAIDPIFNCSPIIDEGGGQNFPFYWSGTTHANFQDENSGGYASYLCFGEGLGWMEEPPMSGNFTLMDVHGAGAQRSDPKVGNPGDWPYGHGPQGDVIRIYNYVRLVRDADSSMSLDESSLYQPELRIFPNPVSDILNIEADMNISGELFIIDTFGKVVMSNPLSFSAGYSIQIEHLASGIYFVRIVNSSTVLSGRFVKY